MNLNGLPHPIELFVSVRLFLFGLAPGVEMVRVLSRFFP
jgi:hypothetical protein